MLWEACVGLFEEIRKKSDEYISIDFAVECLALREGSLYKAVMVLLHYKVDEATPCYMQDEYFNFTDIDNDNDKPSEYSAFEILTDIKKEAESNGGIESKIITISDSLKSKISKYYWERDLLLSVMPIEKSFEFKVVDLANSREITPPYINKTVSRLANHDYKFYLFKTPLLTLHEAACIVSDYDPELVDRCRNDTNFSENFSSYLRASRFLDACIGAGEIPYDFNLGIEAHHLKSYLQRENIIIAGFNDQIAESLHTESTEVHTEFKTTIANLELDLAIEKNKVEKLNEEIDHLKAEIAKWEASQAVQQDCLLSQIFDESATERYAPDLALSIKLWEHIYITNPKSDSHTNKAIKWLKSNTGYEVSKKAGSASKIREITTPFVSWGNLRDKNYKK